MASVFNSLILCAGLLLSSNMAVANDVAALFGRWGSDRQCSGEPIKPGGTVAASAVEIGDEWLQQGGVWCHLTWFSAQSRPNNLYATARARCGEDSLRSYWLAMVLETRLNRPVLTLIWDEQIWNGPYARCTE